MTPKHGTEYLDTIADFIAGTSYSDLPEAVRVHTKYVWMDTVGAILGGSLEPQASALSRRFGADAGAATILGPGFPRSEPMNAALVNGTAGTFLELDEGHIPICHPAIYAVPALLAVGEDTGASGRQLIEALVLSYEITVRLNRTTDFISGMHPHGSLGVVGAAVGVARLLGYDAPKIREAINVAACLNGATPRVAAVEGALVRNVYAGFSGHMGVLIPHLVESGLTGLRDGLSETYTHFIAGGFDPARMVQGLGDEYQISSNYFKIHAACRHVHAPLDALGKALDGRRLEPQEVERVRVVGNSYMTRLARPDPENPLAAKFSVPFAIATAIVKDGTGMQAFQQDAVDDPAARSLAQRVTVEEDSSYTAGWPSRQTCLVEVTTTTGETLVGRVDNPRGEAVDPVSYRQVEDKFLGLTSPIFRGAEGRAADLFKDLDSVRRASELTEELRRLAG